MRKRDKIKNIQKANKLVEQRYLKSKGIITEGIMGQLEYEILEGYLEAAFWTEEEQLEGKTISDLSPEANESANNDVLYFMDVAGEQLQGMEPKQIGHDLWLTRNGHGAGFWDRGLGEKGEILTKLASDMGPKEIYVGDDGLVYFS